MPDDSGPKISTMRPRGSPPIPSARSSESEPVEIAPIDDLRPVAHAHDRALAELPLDLAERDVERFLAISSFDLNLLSEHDSEHLVLRPGRVQTER